MPNLEQQERQTCEAELLADGVSQDLSIITALQLAPMCHINTEKFMT